MKKYYIDSLQYIRNKDPDATFLLFTNDIDMVKNKSYLTNDRIQVVISLDEIDNLYLMSMCEKGGIGTNSSYSWWGGWLNDDKNKLVLYLKYWLKDKNEYDVHWEGSIIINN